MTITHLLTDTCTVEAPIVGTNAHGSTVVTGWTPTAGVKCRLDQYTETEDRDGRTVNYRRGVLFLDAAATIDDSYRVQAAGRTWRVLTVNPVHARGSTHHFEVAVEAVD